MKIISVPDSTWQKRLTCERCKTVYEADQDDLDYEQWKTSGYWFNDTAVTEMHYSVKCPSCNVWEWIDDKEIPVLLRDKLRNEYNASNR